jgi:2-C-methyl-D-erythritol 4-phosphate cytidylyltransferase
VSGVWAVVVAAGSGRRFGGSKQYEVLAGRPVVEWSLCAARAVCDGVVLVVPAADAAAVSADAAAGSHGADLVVAGGATRSASVRNGLAAVPDDAEVIVVHDAARPLAGPELFTAVIDAVRAGADGALCAIPVTDTIRHVQDGTIDRTPLVSVQTPQAFRAAALRAAHASGAEATDDAAVVEAAGGMIVVVPGSAANIKITHPSDLVVAAALLAARP